MPVSEFKRRRKRKRDDDRPATVVAIAQARKGRSHNAALLVDYARTKLEIDGVPIEMANYSVSYIYNLLNLCQRC